MTIFKALTHNRKTQRSKRYKNFAGYRLKSHTFG